MLLKFLSSILTYFIITSASAQLTFDTSLSAVSTIKKYLTEGNSGIFINSVTFKGARQSFAGFNDPSKYAVINRGVAVSTGNIFDAIGPNNQENVGLKTFGPADSDLEFLGNGKSYDAAIIIIDFIPITDTLSFDYFFASEEYPEYVNKGVNDVFAFILKKEGDLAGKNLAVFANAAIPISVDNINGKKNNHLYIANSIWSYSNVKRFENNKAAGERSLQYQFDGFTKLLNAETVVIPGERYQLKIGIADIGDPFYDSGVFLKSGTFSARGKKPTSINFLKLLTEHINWKLPPTFEQKTVNSYAFSLKINYDTDKYALRTDMRSSLNQLAELLNADERLNLTIIGHTDNQAPPDYNLTLSRNRAEGIYNYLISNGIHPKRLTFSGKGETEPLFANTSETFRKENRRVEFILQLGE
jgi:outer membrane protein OmpA-like peptidoglycan-associated protein